MLDRTCPICGTPFSQARPHGKPQKYCSKACYSKAATDRRRTERPAKLASCDSCGTPCRRFGPTAYCGAEACVKERNRRRSAAAYARNKARQGEAQWRSDMKRKYGISVAEYECLLEAQEHRCRICGEGNGMTTAGRERRFAVDHCHTSGVVRGLLCTPCNLMLGYAKDNPAVLAAAIKYLTP